MPSFDSLLSDVRHGVRALARNRGLTATVLVTFALCLGANIALFTIVRAVLLTPLPFSHPEQLVTVYNGYPNAGVARAGISSTFYLERHEGIAAFAESAALHGGGVTIGDSGSPERVASMNVTPSFFRTLGVSAALGRTFTEEEGTDGKNNVILLSDGIWRQKFGADPAIVGRQVRLNGGKMSTVVGVMPADFHYLSSRARVWLPIAFGPDDRKEDRRHSNNFEMIARLKPDATIAAAKAQIIALNQAAEAHDPYAKIVADAGFFSEVADLHDDHVAQTRPIVIALQAGVLLLLAIGVVNLINLLLVSASVRAKELSVRQVLGASTGQLARQIFAETLVLAVVGGALGLGVGWLGLRGLDLLGAGRQLPHAGEFRLDGFVCLVALGASVVLGFVLALPVLWQSVHRNLAGSLSVESRGGTTSRDAHLLRHILIGAQFALAFLLLASAGLLALSFSRVLAIKPGFQPDHVLSAEFTLPNPKYINDDARIAFLARLEHELQTVPGITSVAFGTMMPFGPTADNNAVTVEGYTPPAGDSLQAHFMSGVTGDFFTTLGIPLREGRLLTSDDVARKDRVCIIDEVVAKRYWPKGNALGGRINNGPPDSGDKLFTVIGVVGAIKQEGLVKQRAAGEVYLPYSFYAGRTIGVAIRTTQAPESLGPALRAAVLRLDSDLPLSELKPMPMHIDDTLAQRRSPLLLAIIFSALALLLAGVGLYGVLAYAVTQRRREIGVRMALGAHPAQIRAQFLGLGARLVVIGSGIGLVLAWWAGQLLTSQLYDVDASRPLVFGVTLLVLVIIALIACFLPAARAARVPPMEALRGD